jgi:hypothetical protein
MTVSIIGAAVGVLIAPGVFTNRAEAQKQGAPLWYSVVSVKRVQKPNRDPGKKPPATQKSALLTLQWRLLQEGDDKNAKEVDARKEFHTGDRVRLAITANQDGYLYIVNRPPGKDSVLLFPDLRINKGLNRVLKDQEYTIPSYCKEIEDLKDPKDCWMLMQPPAGTETMIVIFSRDKITTLPNEITEPYSPVKRSVVDGLIESSQQRVEQWTGKLAITNKKAVRFATRVQNTNRRDNEELIATIVITHAE